MANAKLYVEDQIVNEIDDAHATTLVWDEFPDVFHRVLPTKPWGDHVHPAPVIEPWSPPKDRGLFADPDLPNLLGHPGIKREDLTPSIGTLLIGIQLDELTDAQKDELALLVEHRGVVFFRDQNITAQGQRDLFDYYGEPEVTLKQPETEKKPVLTHIQTKEVDYRAAYTKVNWPFADFHADSSSHINPPSFSMLRVDELPPTGGDTTWVSGYGTYDALSGPLRKIVDGLNAWHTSLHVNGTVEYLWKVRPNFRPVETRHPVVRVHPVTGYKVLNLNSGYVDRIDGFNRLESDKFLDLLFTHIHTAHDHMVRFHWEKNSVAFWDNRAVTHRATHDYAPLHRHGVRVTNRGDIPKYDASGKTRKDVLYSLRNSDKIPQVHSAYLREGNFPQEFAPRAPRS
ncbi:sulfonate dioxygenase [Trichoderma asperellum]|nr:taurine dioxygenase [Trichoderma asperelloides]